MKYLNYSDLIEYRWYSCKMYDGLCMNLQWIGGDYGLFEDCSGQQYMLEGDVRYVNELGFDYNSPEAFIEQHKDTLSPVLRRLADK